MGTLILDDIRDAISAVSPIMAGAEEAWNVYHIRGGQLRAKNRIMRAGIPIMYDEDLVVPGREFEKLVKAIRKNPEVTIGKNQLLFKVDKMRVTLPRLSDEKNPEVDEIEGDVIDLTPEFMEIVKTLNDLLEDAKNPDWQNSIICVNGQMISTFKGQILMVADYEPFKENDTKCLLPFPLVKFLLNKKTPPDEMILTETQVQFNWPDDSWVISSVITGKVPAKLFKLLDTIEEISWEFTDEHREAVKDAAALGAESISFKKDGATALLATGQIDMDVEFPVPETGTSRWDVGHLLKAMNVASKFNFSQYPQPCIFVGDKVRGMLAGKIT